MQKSPPPLVPFSFMASDNLDIPHISIAGVPDEDNSSSALALPSPSLRPRQPNWERQHSSPPSELPTDNHAKNLNHANLNGHLSNPIRVPVLPVRLAQNFPDVSGSPSNASNKNSSPLLHPSSTHARSRSIRWTKPMSRDYTSSHVYRRNRWKRTSTGSANSDVTNALPSTHSSDAGSRPSTVTSFFRRAVHFRPSSSSPSGESRERDTGSVTTRNDAQKCDIVDQSTFLDNLEGRFEAAKKLYGESVDLQMLYESGPVATIKDLRMTGKEVPCYLQSTKY